MTRTPSKNASLGKVSLSKWDNTATTTLTNYCAFPAMCSLMGFISSVALGRIQADIISLLQGLTSNSRVHCSSLPSLSPPDSSHESARVKAPLKKKHFQMNPEVVFLTSFRKRLVRGSQTRQFPIPRHLPADRASEDGAFELAICRRGVFLVGFIRESIPDTEVQQAIRPACPTSPRQSAHQLKGCCININICST